MILKDESKIRDALGLLLKHRGRELREWFGSMGFLLETLLVIGGLIVIVTFTWDWTAHVLFGDETTGQSISRSWRHLTHLPEIGLHGISSGLKVMFVQILH